MEPRISNWAKEYNSLLLREYSRAKRFVLEGVTKVTQEVIAVYMCGNQGAVAAVENLNSRFAPRPLWHLRRGIGQALLTIKVSEEDAMKFWHEVNKYWVAAGNRALLVPDPYEMTYEQILSEVYADIAEAKAKPAYRKYEEECKRMRDNRKPK